jgi:AcrR family transcriptional regulator
MCDYFPLMSAKLKLERASASYHHGNLRDALIAAALALEPEHGPLGISLREVARVVGVAHTAAYHHFASKEALVLAVADHGFERLLAELDAELHESPDPFFSVIALGEAYVRFAARAPSQFRFMYGTTPTAALEERHSAVMARFHRAADGCVEAELVKRGQADRAAAQFWSVAHGMAGLTIAGALDGAPRSKVSKRSPKQRERRALDLVRATMVGMMFGTRPADSKWRPAPPSRLQRAK